MLPAKAKILYLIESEDPGGAENILLSLVSFFKDKASVYVGCLKKGWTYQSLLKKGVKPILIKHGKGAFDIKLLYQLIKVIRSKHINLVHSHLFDINFYSCIAAKITGVSHVATEHGDIHHLSKQLNYRMIIKAKAISRFSNKLVFVSRFTKDKFLEIANPKGENCAVIYNGVDLKNYQLRVCSSKKKAEIGIKEDELIVGNVASLYPVKGQLYLLKAASLVLSQIPKARFIIVGEGPLEGELKKEASRLGISPYVKFLGFRSDVNELLKIMDVFVLCSLSEAMPLSLIEAMASGTPVVATKVGGVPEVVDDGIDGILVPRVDPEALAEKIILLIKDKEKAKLFAKNAYKKVSFRFSLNGMLQKYEHIYDTLLRRSKR